MRRLAFLVAAILAATSAHAVEEADRSAGRDVVAKQIEAFRRDDAGGAYAFAAPGIRALFGSDEAFLDMVRRAYPPIHRPRIYSFGAAQDIERGFEQAVTIQDGAGADWDAVYTFERQPDGTWMISACRLVKRPGEAV